MSVEYRDYYFDVSQIFGLIKEEAEARTRVVTETKPKTKTYSYVKKKSKEPTGFALELKKLKEKYGFEELEVVIHV